MEVLKSAFVKNRIAGIFVGGANTYLKLHDVYVRNTRSNLIDGYKGTGLEVDYGANAEVFRSTFKNNREISVLAGALDTHLTLQDVIILGTQERENATNSQYGKQCQGFGSGIGMGSLGGASIDANQFIISDNAHCGAQLAFGCDGNSDSMQNGGLMTLSNGIVSHNKICGVNVQTENVNLANLSNNVSFLTNNYNNLDTQTHPTPVEYDSCDDI